MSEVLIDSHERLGKSITNAERVSVGYGQVTFVSIISFPMKSKDRYCAREMKRTSSCATVSSRSTSGRRMRGGYMERVK